jgi:hypothetical protein
MKKAKNYILFLVVLFSLSMQAQQINSPYSRYGLGLLHGENTHTKLMGMGGIAIGVASSELINPGNAASYAAFDSTSFLFDIGMVGNITGMSTDYQSETSNYAALTYIMFGFPVTRWWKMGLGMLPYSQIGYDVKIYIPVPSFSNVVNDIEGSGGINQFFIGNAFKIGKNLRFGVDAAYLFGKGDRSSKVYFPDSIYIFGTKTISSTKGGDFIFDYGLQYDVHFGTDKILTLGLIYSNQWNMNAKIDYTTYTFTGGYGDAIETIKDTIAYSPDTEGKIVIPQRIGTGITLLQKELWMVGADFEWQNWNKYTAFGKTDSLDNSWRIAIGGRFTPKHTSISSLGKRITYRAGFRYYNSYLSIFNHPINEYGISFGLTFPMKKSKTTVDLGFEVGKRGTKEDGLIQETFFNMSLGFSIHESWFHKRRYQ